jgi:hypothetical protein
VMQAAAPVQAPMQTMAAMPVTTSYAAPTTSYAAPMMDYAPMAAPMMDYAPMTTTVGAAPIMGGYTGSIGSPTTMAAFPTTGYTGSIIGQGY